MNRMSQKRILTITLITFAVLAITITVITITRAGLRFIRSDSLNQAARAGDFIRTSELLREGVAVNGQGMHAMTPIMCAAEGGHFEIVRLLIAHGADVNSHNASGSALMWAVDSGNAELVHYLLKCGADARWKNALQSTALDLAEDQSRTEISRILQTWNE